ncbi:MAG: hypothetical protein Kow00120_05940 [Anaerolineae bacterium]
MRSPHESFNTLVYQTLESAAALLEAGRPAEALHAIKVLAEMEITARQREQYIALRREIEAQLVHDSWVTLQMAHPEPLTFSLLTEEVIPYLQALHRVHELVARLQGKPPAWDPEIRQLSHHSPLSVTFGYWHPDIIQTILDVVFEERRGPARRIQAGESPAQPLLTRVNATYKLLEKVIPTATSQQKNALATQILPDIDLLASSPVEAQVIGVSVRGDEPGPPPEAREATAATGAPAARREPSGPPPEDLPEEPPPPTAPRYIGSKPEAPVRPRYPRHRVTRPAPKPYVPPERTDEDEDNGVEET